MCALCSYKEKSVYVSNRSRLQSVEWFSGRFVQGSHAHSPVFHANAQARHRVSGATAQPVYPNRWTGTMPVEFTASHVRPVSGPGL